MRARDLGIEIGSLAPGEHCAITDVPGVRVGHATLVEGDDVRTGVTVIRPHEGEPLLDPVFAGVHRLNGNGELTGCHWIEESGLLASTIGLTNTHSVGVVRDALVADAVAGAPADVMVWSMPVVGETYDGGLNDINGFHVGPQHVRAALDAAAPGAVAEGSVGSGTGMVCHEFKGGIGTASRVLPGDQGGHTVGVLVQANHGTRRAAAGERGGGGRAAGRDPAAPVPDAAAARRRLDHRDRGHRRAARARPVPAAGAAGCTRHRPNRWPGRQLERRPAALLCHRKPRPGGRDRRLGACAGRDHARAPAHRRPVRGGGGRHRGGDPERDAGVADHARPWRLGGVRAGRRRRCWRRSAPPRVSRRDRRRGAAATGRFSNTVASTTIVRVRSTESSARISQTRCSSAGIDSARTFRSSVSSPATWWHSCTHGRSANRPSRWPRGPACCVTKMNAVTPAPTSAGSIAAW